MLAALGRHPALPALFDAEVKVTRDPSDRARLLYSKARAMEEHLRQTGPALKVYREALALDPGNLIVLKAIERALRREKAWAPLADTYAELASAVEDPSLRAAWTSVRARLTKSELGDAAQALALYRTALDADPQATTALSSLKRLSVSQKRWPELVDALRREHDLCQDPNARLAILATLAELQEKRLGDTEAAVATLEEAVALRPDQRSLLADLARLHRAAGRHAIEASALSRLVEQLEDRDEKASISHRIGRIYEQELGDSDRARPWYERTLEADPTHRAASLALVRLFEARNDFERVIEVWSRRADAIAAPRERASILHRVGELLERRLGRAREAADAHARALGLDPEHQPAFEDLSRLLAADGRWRELAELYQRQIDRAPSDALAVAWLFRLGGIVEDRLEDPEGAITVYERILEREPQHLGALHAISRAAERAKRWERLVTALHAEAEQTGDRTRQLMLRHRAAEVMADGLRDANGAARALRAILKVDPKHRPSLESLAQLHFDAGRWEELVAVYQRLLPLLGTAAEKVRLSYRIGELQELQLGDDRAAVESYRAALRLDPELEQAREALIGALARTGAHADLVAALEEKLGRTEGGHERARLATELGALYETQLDDREAALKAYEKALEAAPLHRPALDARERLLTEAADWSTLVHSLSDEAAASDDPFLSTHAALRAALVLSEQQGAVAPALEAFRPVFGARPDHLGALLAVEEIYARTRDDDGLAATYAKMAEVVRDPKAKLAALEELARARAAAGGETTDVQRRILRLAPDDAAALEAIAREAEASGDRDGLLAMHARLASTADDPMVGAFHQSRVGELLANDGDAGGALAAFRAALGLDPGSVAATRGLTRAARQAHDPDALRHAARFEEEVTRDREVAVGLLLEAARAATGARRPGRRGRGLRARAGARPRERGGGDGAARVAHDARGRAPARRPPHPCGVGREEQASGGGAPPDRRRARRRQSARPAGGRGGDPAGAGGAARRSGRALPSRRLPEPKRTVEGRRRHAGEAHLHGPRRGARRARTCSWPPSRRRTSATRTPPSAACARCSLVSPIAPRPSRR